MPLLSQGRFLEYELHQKDLQSVAQLSLPVLTAEFVIFESDCEGTKNKCTNWQFLVSILARLKEEILELLCM